MCVNHTFFPRKHNIVKKRLICLRVKVTSSHTMIHVPKLIAIVEIDLNIISPLQMLPLSR